MKHVLRLLSIAILFFPIQSVAVVKVEILDVKEKIASLKIINKIEYEEEEIFISEYNKLIARGYKLKLNAVVLNTAGGNGYAAKKIGVFIREKKLNTYVASGANCASACIYVLIGGVVRMAYGRIAVHRTSYGEEYRIEWLEKGLREANKKTVAHVEAMGISILLADAIVNTPNWAIRELDDRDRRRWGVHGTEQLYEEMWFRKTAAESNVSLEHVIDAFNKNVSACQTPPMNFEMTMWECVKNRIKK